MYDELSEMLETYKSAMSEEDVNLLGEISAEISDSLNRVCINGGWALAIVERMRAMGVKGGEPVPMELNSMLPQIVNTGCEAFEAQWKDFSVERVLDLDSSWRRCLLPSMTSERQLSTSCPTLVVQC